MRVEQHSTRPLSKEPRLDRRGSSGQSANNKYQETEKRPGSSDVLIDIVLPLLSSLHPREKPTMDSLPTRQTLLLKIRDHDDNAAWEEFVELYTPLIYRFCLSRGVSRNDVADVTQDTMRSVANAIQRFEYDPTKGKFRSWLFRVTYSKLARHFEKKNRQPQGTGSDTIRSMLDELPSEEIEYDWDLEYRRRVFSWATEKVKPEFADHVWNAFWMTAVEEKSGADVAEDLEMSVGAVYVAKSRVIARLRERVATVNGDIDLPEQMA